MTGYDELDIFGGSRPMKREGKLTIVATRMSEAEVQSIKIAARGRGCSVAAIVREAMQDWLRRNVVTGS